MIEDATIIIFIYRKPNSFGQWTHPDFGWREMIFTYHCNHGRQAYILTSMVTEVCEFAKEFSKISFNFMCS